MRLLSIEYVNDGDVIAKDVYDSKLSLLINKGKILSSKLIEKLKLANITYIYIDDEISKGIEISSIVDDSFKLKAVSILREIYNRQIKNVDKTIVIEESQIIKLKKLIDGFIDDIYDSRDKKYFSTELLGADMYTYNHSLEVAILSLKIGYAMGLDREQLNRLGTGAILSDIGKSRVPQELLNKKGKLDKNEFNEVKKHVDYGYEMIKSSVNLTPHSKQIVYMHHEKLDGSGYPKGITGKNIPLFVRIVTVADIFSAIASDRMYSDRRSIEETIDILRVVADIKMDRDVIISLNSVVYIYPPGTIIKLTNGEIGIVIKNNSSPTRPIVGIIRDKKIYKEINLMKELTIFVEKVLPRIDN